MSKAKIKFGMLKYWQQQAMYLYVVEQRGYKYIAEKLSIPYDTVYGAIQRLLPHLDRDHIIRNMPRKTIFVIGDTQCKQGISLEYMRWIGYYIAKTRPDVIVHIGDHYDMASLSSYDKGTMSAEGRRILDDLEAGDKGLAYLEEEISAVVGYKPRKVVTLGNHEERIDRYVNNNPEFAGTIGTDKLAFSRYGWEVYPFLKPCDIDGISFQHYVQNPMTGKPMGGQVMNILKNAGTSFVMGHKQVLDMAMRGVLGGKEQLGLIVGACYIHDEEYKGYQGNNHFRGCVMLTEVSNGSALPAPVSLDHMRYLYELERM